MLNKSQNVQTWRWENLNVSWQMDGKELDSSISIVFIHGFGGCKEHWRHNLPILAKHNTCYAIDLIGFGESSQPQAKLKQETGNSDGFTYCFDNWGKQISDFCIEVVQKPVLLVGNSIGGVIALRASKILRNKCIGIVLIDCAQRAMDDKRLKEQMLLMRFIRPILKTIVKQRWLSQTLFKNAADPKVIKRILNTAYPSGKNIDDELIELLHKPSRRAGADEAFRGFINLFDDYLATELMKDMTIPVDLIWGEQDPWEPISEAKKWYSNISCIRSLKIISEAGHCPHDEKPEEVNSQLLRIIQEAI